MTPTASPIQEPSVALQVDRLSKTFGGLQAVHQVSFQLVEGELKGLIGPNGAGKSTLFNLISGLSRPSGGRVLLWGEDVTRLTADRIVQKGVARTFQTVKLLRDRTVLETMLTAFFLSRGYSVLDAIFTTPKYLGREKALREKALEYLALLGVEDLKNQNGNELAYGLQRKVSIAMALCLSPKILLLDEPMAGLTHSEKAELMEVIRKLRELFGLGIILVEHDMKVIMDLCESIVVVNQGQVIAEGTADRIRHDPAVIEAYLGEPRK